MPKNSKRKPKLSDADCMYIEKFHTQKNEKELSKGIKKSVSLVRDYISKIPAIAQDEFIEVNIPPVDVDKVIEEVKLEKPDFFARRKEIGMVAMTEAQSESVEKPVRQQEESKQEYAERVDAFNKKHPPIGHNKDFIVDPKKPVI